VRDANAVSSFFVVATGRSVKVPVGGMEEEVKQWVRE
jgi:hypothetical protein